MQAIDRAVQILETIAAHDGEIGISRLAELVGYSKSTTSRFVSALEEKEMIQRSDASKLSIGPWVYRITQKRSFQDRLIDISAQPLYDLNRATGEAVGLSVLNGMQIQYIFDLPSANAVQVIDWTMKTAPLHLTSSGKIFLSQFNAHTFDSYTKKPLEYATPYSIVTPDRLQKEIEDVRQNNFASTDEEFALETYGLAVPIYHKGERVVAAITIYGPKFRVLALSSRIDLIKVMREATAKIEAELNQF